MTLKNLRSLFLFMPLLLASCSVEIQGNSTLTTTPPIITATLPSTTTSRPSETELPPHPQPTVIPIDGNTSTPLNVRAEPSTASEVVGIIPANSSVQIIGKDIGGNWWQIVYEAGINGKGWVTAQYVETAGKPEVPVVGGGESDPKSEFAAVVIQQLNIRSGPGTSFNSLGVLNANDVISLTGKNSNGVWLQFEYPGGPEGKGWINSVFVKTDNVATLPIVSDAGDVIGTGTPADTPLPPAPTIVPAPMDFDTAETPLKAVTFNRTGTNTFIYSGDVSTPNGDTEDWITFTPYSDVVFVDIQCIGSTSIRVEFNTPDTVLLCNQSVQAVTVPAGSQTLVYILAVPSSGQLQYTKYIITIRVNP